jgi:hypothetical protein
MSSTGRAGLPADPVLLCRDVAHMTHSFGRGHGQHPSDLSAIDSIVAGISATKCRQE